jgi:hypothetical protein
MQTSFRPYRNLGHFELITELMKGLEGEYSARLEHDCKWARACFIRIDWARSRSHEVKLGLGTRRNRTDELSERFHTGRTWEAVIVLYTLGYAMYNWFWVGLGPTQAGSARRFLAVVTAYTAVGELRNTDECRF